MYACRLSFSAKPPLSRACRTWGSSPLHAPQGHHIAPVLALALRTLALGHVLALALAFALLADLAFALAFATTLCLSLAFACATTLSLSSLASNSEA